MNTFLSGLTMTFPRSRLLGSRLGANLSLLLRGDRVQICNHYDPEAFLAHPAMVRAVVFAAHCVDTSDAKGLADLDLYKEVSLGSS